MLAFDVGAGKTYIMIAAAMKMRQEGISRKNLFVVPNNIVGQWELSFKHLYPNAKVLTIEPKFFKPHMRTKVLSQMRDGDYDGIIIAYSCFERIPLSANYAISEMNKSLSELSEAIRKIGFTSGSRTALNKEKDYIKKIASNLISSFDSCTDSIVFDDFEINSIFVDEAHNFKNIPIRTNMKDLRGINTKGSNKCLEMLHKVHFVQETNNGRGVIFATGTPLCNSISDVYNMQCFLQYETLKKHKLNIFDNWVKTFAQSEYVSEIDVDTSKFRIVTRFAKFHNLPELSKMFADVAIFHAVDSEKDLPGFNGYDDVIIKRNKAINEYMQKLCKRTELIRTGLIDKRADNMLKVSTDGRKAALDLRLVGQKANKDKYSKVLKCAKNVFEIYKHKSKVSQIIFCDYSTPKKDVFNVYSELSKILVELGADEKDIAFIHSYHTEERKVALYSKFNKGEIRILIGSTFKLGIGANVQTRLKAVHHLDIPWRPSDMIQREGRILRKGNENTDVKIFRYICEGSFDSYSWQILETKQKFISDFLKGSAYQREASDLEENILNYAQVKAIAIAQPLMKNLAEKENELSRLYIVSGGQNDSKKRLKINLEKIKENILIYEKRYVITIKNLEYVKTITEDSYKKAYQQIKDFDFTEPFTVLDFNVTPPNEQDIKNPYIYIERQNIKYKINIGNSNSGNARRIINFLKQFDKHSDEIYKRKENLYKEKDEHIKNINKNTDYKTQIDILQTEIADLKKEIIESELMEEDE